jgi:hypothetical protein
MTLLEVLVNAGVLGISALSAVALGHMVLSIVVKDRKL